MFNGVMKNYFNCFYTDRPLISGFGSQTFDYWVRSLFSTIDFQFSDSRLRTSNFQLQTSDFRHSISEFGALFPTIDFQFSDFRLRTSNFRPQTSDFRHSISEFYFRPLPYSFITSIIGLLIYDLRLISLLRPEFLTANFWYPNFIH